MHGQKWKQHSLWGAITEASYKHVSVGVHGQAFPLPHGHQAGEREATVVAAELRRCLVPPSSPMWLLLLPKKDSAPPDPCSKA